MPAKVARSKPKGRSVRSLAGTVYITRQVHFNASHRLHNPAKSRRWNDEHYGLCTNPHGHGHNYVLEVTVAGNPDPDTGYVMNLARLKDILTQAVVDPCDHKHLNEDVPFLKGIIPSTENLVIAFWDRIEPMLESGRLYRIRLFETPRNFVEYLGEKPLPAS